MVFRQPETVFEQPEKVIEELEKVIWQSETIFGQPEFRTKEITMSTKFIKWNNFQFQFIIYFFLNFTSTLELIAIISSINSFFSFGEIITESNFP